MSNVDTTEIAAFRAKDVLHYWPDIVRALECVPHIWEDDYDLDVLYQEVLDHKVQVWGIGDSGKWKVVLFTDVVQNTKGKTLRLFLAFGQGLDKFIPMLDATLEKFARVQGCNTIAVVGRQGWIRKLRAIGFRKELTIISRPVVDRMDS